MKVVKVYGALRERLGQCRFELNVATPAQAIKALCVNFPGLDKWLIDSEQDGVGYRVRVGKEEASPEDMSVLGLPWSEREVFSITPVIAGAGGFGRFLLGGLLIGASFLFPGAGLFGAGFGVFGPLAPATIATLTTVGTVTSAIGAALILSGTAQLLSPQPADLPGLTSFGGGGRNDSFNPSNNDPADNRSSYIYNGAVNLTAQGNPVPICYGRMRVGSVVVSAGVSTTDI